MRLKLISKLDIPKKSIYSVILFGVTTLMTGLLSLPALAEVFYFNLDGEDQFGNEGTFEVDTYTYFDAGSGITATINGYDGKLLDAVTIVRNIAPSNARGIALTGTPDENFGTLFKISFDADVLISQYIVSFVSQPTVGSATLELDGGIPYSPGNEFNVDGTYVFGGKPIILSANTTATIRAVITDGKGENYLRGIYATRVPVPIETDALPLVGSTVLFGGGLWLKRRRSDGKLDLLAQAPESK